LPHEDLMLGVTSSGDFLQVKGVIEGVLAALHSVATLDVQPYSHPLFEPGRAVELVLAGERFGFLGEVSDEGLKEFEIRTRTTVAEVRVALLEKAARLIPQAVVLSPYPTVSRDLNLVVDEATRWADVERSVRSAAGRELAQLQYLDTYRDPERLGAGKKSLLFSIVLRGLEGTLTSSQADLIRDALVARCEADHGAKLRI
jgi:phenylalanyl-tRNA synthetase beta chain